MKRLSLFTLLLIAILVPGRARADIFSPIFESDSIAVINQNDTIMVSDESISPVIMEPEENPVLKVALVLSDIYGKKDMEFSRGFIMGISESQLPQNSISLKMLNGEIPEDSLLIELVMFEPHTVVVTQEKELSELFLELMEQNDIELINAFGVKGDEYLNRSNVSQVLTPSGTFNLNAADYMVNTFPEAVLLIVGDADPADSILKEIGLAWPGEQQLTIMPKDLSLIPLESGVKYIIYPASSSNADIKGIMTDVRQLMIDYPDADITVMGRPNWIAFSDLNNLVSNLDVYVPSRCYFDPSSYRGKKFITDYNAKFGHAPIRSYPVYAVMGYDIAQYFLPHFYAENKYRLDIDWPDSEMIQSHLIMVKNDYFSGYYNRGTYMLHFEPWGTVNKIVMN